MGLKLVYRTLGNVATNCYYLYNEDTREGILVDPADCFETIKTMVESSGSELKAVLITHGHFDHVGAALEVKEKMQVPLYAAEAEKNVLNNPSVNLSAGMGADAINMAADVWLKDGEELELAGIKIKAIHTPGHTEGGMCYYVSEAGVLFSGDTLFCESVGRTDFPTGSMREIVDSIKTKLFILPDDTKVFPGHGESTSIANEKKYNPFCQ